MRALALRRLPRMVFDYVDGGSWAESTLRANTQAFESVRFRQRVCRDVSARTTQTTLLNSPAQIPAAISPTGMLGLLHPEGELAVARAAAAFGIPYSLSIASSHSLEAVRAASNGELWMQLSVLKDTAFMQGLIERARTQRCAALILTLDFHVAAPRHRDARNGLGLPPRPRPAALLNLLCKPRWLWRMRRRAPLFGNIMGHARGVSDMPSFLNWYKGQFELNLGWHHVEWVKRHWRGALIVKGILEPDDARRAFDAGADAVSVSNQGGRQLDGAPSALEVLPEIVAAAGSRRPVFLDGGIRAGQDILKALGLGARGVLLGRAPLYGLGACGERGVRAVLDILRDEIDLTLAMCGCPDASGFSRRNLRTEPPFAGLHT
ncbi:MAG: alpha-hydroxy-acid oxidizing protein [Burkholderiaceae bacterium]|jgi:L-lactate dehydrogenase (cytochrome)|nr:alpha-hydroxy-acid oxidizing protein [Burkholderiaceae bacterium]